MAIQRIENVKLDKLIISWEYNSVEKRKVEKSMVEALNALKL